MEMTPANAWKPVLRQVRKAFALLCAVVVLATSASAGSRYVFCSMMHAVVDRPCCDLHVHARADGLPEVGPRSDCCSLRTLDATPPGGTASAPSVPRAVVTGSLVVPRVERAFTSRATPARYDVPTIGPPRPSDIPRRLRVFLI